MKKILSAIFFVSVVALVAVGCGKKADPSKPIDQIKNEVSNMSVQDLESTAKAYAKEIQGKKADVDKVKAKLKDLSPKELLGSGAKEIKDELSKIGSEVKALSQRYDIYVKEFSAKGGDLSSIKV